MEIKDLNKGFKQIEDKLRKELAKSDGTKTTYTESDVINNCIDMIFSLKHILNNKIESGEYVKADGWISVEDRLPTITKEIIETELDDEVPMYIVMIKGATIPTALCYDGETWHEYFDRSIVYDVTHWQPLPSPPKGDK